MLVDFDSLKHVPAWLERGLARPGRAARIAYAVDTMRQHPIGI
jgi:hypothetical protein